MSISKVSIFPKILYHVLYRNLHNTSLHLTKLISDNFHVSGPEWFFFSYFKYWYFRSLKRFRDCDFFCQCPWTSWNNEKWYNKRALIWHFTLVFMKSYAGNWQINCNSRNCRNQMTEQYRTIGSEIQGFLSDRQSFYRTCPSVRRYFAFTATAMVRVVLTVQVVFTSLQTQSCNFEDSLSCL